MQVFRDAASGMGSLPQISLKITEEFRLPVPPLEVQYEIVRVLDSFTSFTVQLTVERIARKKQYEVYRNNLLTFGTEIPCALLKDVAVIERGTRVVRNQLTESGQYPVYQNALAPMGYYNKNNRLAQIIHGTAEKVAENRLVTVF